MRRAAIRRLLEVLGRPASRTEIVKLMFLVDIELSGRGHRPLFTWIRWHYGPFSRQILDSLDDLEENGLVQVERYIDLWTLTVRKIEYQVPEKSSSMILRDHAVEEAVEKIAKEWRDRSLDELVRYVYSLPQVRGKKLGEAIVL